MPQQSIEWQRYHAVLPDGGPLYTETDTSHFIVEPWNALSSLLFLVPAIFWAYKLKRAVEKERFSHVLCATLDIGRVG